MFTYLNKPFYLVVICVISIASSASLQAEQSKLHQYINSNVLGTSFEMSIKAPKEQAEQTEEKVLTEIKRLEKIFSTYDKTSEVSQLNQLGHINNISKDLLTVVEHCEYWQQSLPKSFSCKLGNVAKMWQLFETQQERPNRVKIREEARRALQSEYTSKNLIKGNINSDFTWDFGGIAKGYILDQAMKVAKISAPQASAIKIDIGGDGVYWQTTKNSTADWLIGLAIPNNIDDSQENHMGTYAINTGALAYSGHKSRDRKIRRRSYSHLLVPRDGWPMHNPVTAIVKAPDATSADALATSLTTTDISTALDWLKKQPKYAALLIDSDGRKYASDNWYQHYEHATDQEFQRGQIYQAKISFSLPKLNNAEYRKPYVAIWIENQQRKVIKNLLILGQNERWMQKNRSWWRVQGRKTPNLLDGFARPTRRPGEYHISWNGRNDFGQQLPNGQYKLYAEVAREHGGHEKLSLNFELGEQKQVVNKKGKKEINSLSFESLSHNVKL